jgi:exo-beta-1,3-glucanase (GH17 family)
MRRAIITLLICMAAVLTSSGYKRTSPVALASREVTTSINLMVRDSMTGYAVPSEIVSKDKNLVAKFSTNASGVLSYQLASGRNDLEMQAVGFKNLQTHFEADSRSVTQVTVWLDPLESHNELRSEVINSKLRAGQALLHGHVLDSETRQPLSGAHVYLECAGIEAQTNARGYFLLYAPAPTINPTQELPGSDSLIVYSKGFKIYRRAHVAMAEGATHFIIDMDRGEGLSETDDTHKLMLSPEQLKGTQTEIPRADNEARSDDGLQPESLAVPTSIRVGSSCPSKTTCTVFNVYSLDTYVKNGLDDEWISSWNAESLKAGAIAYRSYGVYHVYHPLSANYDICNTTSCQVNDPTDSATSTINATNNTTGMIVVDSTGNNPFFAEYAAENNDSACADGFTGSPNANWSCLSDPVDAGQQFNGHGRGMCQWGTQRWAVNQGRDYSWIVNHYYNDNGKPNGARSGVLQPQATPTPTPQQRIVGFDYGPFRDGQSPLTGVFPTAAQMQDDMPVLKSIAASIRTYSVTNGFDQIPGLAKQVGLTCVPGAWLGKEPATKDANETEISKLIAVANQSDNLLFVAAGSEALLRGDLSKDQLLAYISRVKQSVSVPVTTAEPWHVWRDNPDLVNAVDLIFMNVHPYWEGQSIENAVTFTLQRYNEIKTKYPNKRIVISETGWPSAGDSRASLANQKKFIQDFMANAAEQNIEVFLFEAFDENWKRDAEEGEVGAHWGFFDSHRQPKIQSTPTPTPTPNLVQFSSPTYSVQEDCTLVNITVNRTGDTSVPAAVDYATSDVTANARRDYISALGTLRFVPGENSKTFAVLINEDSYLEGNETFNVTLSNPSNLTLGTSVATVTIIDDATEPPSNAIDDTPTFVCQQYHDFLNRQADAPGQTFWQSEITSCGASVACIEAKRVNTSGAFYLSIEFQQTGYLVERIYKTAYGNFTGTSTLGGSHTLLVPIVRLSEFLPDTQRIGRGVIVGQGD